MEEPQLRLGGKWYDDNTHGEGTQGKELPHSTGSGLHRWWIILCVPTNLEVFIPPVCKQSNRIPTIPKFSRKTACFRIVSSLLGVPCGKCLILWRWDWMLRGTVWDLCSLVYCTGPAKLYVDRTKH